MGAVLLVAISTNAASAAVEDDFTGDRLSDDWAVTYEAASIGIEVADWAYELRDSRLVVSDIVPDGRTTEGSCGMCGVVLSRPFTAPGEFSLEMQIAWDSDSSAMEACSVRLWSGDQPVVSLGYRDAWIGYRGGACCSPGPCVRNTVPSSGAATFVLTRYAQGAMIALADTEQLNAWTDPSPIDRLQLVFEHAPFEGATFGDVAIDRIRATASGSTPFKRGDANEDLALNIGDAIFILTHLFGAGAEPDCMDAADTNDDGSVNIADAVMLLGYLFSGDAALPSPFPECGPDPTPDDGVSCDSFAACE